MFRSFLFLSCFLSFFVSSITYGGNEVSLAILKTKQWSCSSFPSGVSRGELLQLYLVINVTGLVELNQAQPSLHSPLYLLQSISVKLIHHFLYLIYGYLFFRCLKKGFEEERNKNEDGNSQGLTTS